VGIRVSVKYFNLLKIKLFERLNALLENIGYKVKTSIKKTYRRIVELIAA
jgi:hypothetical protein